MPMEYCNFIHLLNFIFRGLSNLCKERKELSTKDNNSISTSLKLHCPFRTIYSDITAYGNFSYILKCFNCLSFVVDRVKIDHRANYFIQQILYVINGFVDDAINYLLLTNNNKIDDENLLLWSNLIEHSSKTLCGLTVLHYTHPKACMKSGLLPKALSLLSIHSLLSHEARTQILRLFHSLGQDTDVRQYLLTIFSPEILIKSFIINEKVCLSTIEASAVFFDLLYLQKYRVDFSQKKKTIAIFIESKPNNIKSNTNDIVVDSYEKELLECETNLCLYLNPVLQLCYDFLRVRLDTSNVEWKTLVLQLNCIDFNGKDIFNEQEICLSTPINTIWRLSTSTNLGGFADQMMNDILANIRKLLRLKFSDFDHFNLEEAQIVDALSNCCGWQSACWTNTDLTSFEFLQDDLDQVKTRWELRKEDILPWNNANISTSNNLLSNIEESKIISNISFDDFEDIQIHKGHSIIVDQHRITLRSSRMTGDISINQRVAEDSKLIVTRIFGLIEETLKTLLDDWTIIPTETLCRKISFLSIIVRSKSGLSFIDSVIFHNDLVEMLIENITNEKLGLSDYPGMHTKFLEMITSIATVQRDRDVIPSPSAITICTYAIKSITEVEEAPVENVPFLYACLAALITFTKMDKQVRRLVVREYYTIVSIFLRIDEVASLRPLLLLTFRIIDNLVKIDSDGDEMFAYLIIKSLRVGFIDIRMQSYRLISSISEDCPGLIYRTLMRREVEDILYNDLVNIDLTNIENTTATLKAIIACVQDINPKPFWIYTNWTYHWSKYDGGFSQRPLVVPTIPAEILQLITRSKGVYQVPILTLGLQYSTSLMYNCSDGIISNPISNANKSADGDKNLLRDALMTSILPLLPICLEFLTSKGQKKEIKLLQKERKLSKSNSNNNNISKDNNNSILNIISRSQSLPGMGNQAQSDENRKSTNITSYSSSSCIDEVYESLAEATIDALFSFLCFDDMFPMSTYQIHSALFKKVPICICVGIIMTSFPENFLIQRRGMEIFKCFSENNIEMVIVSLSSSPSIMISLNKCRDNLESLSSFCKIVISQSLSRVSNSRGNLLLYSVHLGLVDILYMLHPEPTYLACKATFAFADDDNTCDKLCKDGALINGILFALDGLPNDYRVQVEGIRALSRLSKAKTSLNIIRRCLKIEIIIKRARKSIEDLRDNKSQLFSCEYLNNVLVETNILIKFSEKCSIV
jgi:hypothetical protein